MLKANRPRYLYVALVICSAMGSTQNVATGRIAMRMTSMQTPYFLPFSLWLLFFQLYFRNQTHLDDDDDSLPDYDPRRRDTLSPPRRFCMSTSTIPTARHKDIKNESASSGQPHDSRLPTLAHCLYPSMAFCVPRCIWSSSPLVNYRTVLLCSAFFYWTFLRTWRPAYTTWPTFNTYTFR